MQITIAGAGAMGSRFALMLAESDQSVTVIDGWKDHVEAIKTHGLKATFNGQEMTVNLPAYLQDEINPDLSTDLIILFTKAMQLDGMLKSLRPLIHKDTKVLCLLNGIGHEETIENYVAKENILIGNTIWTAGMDGPGKVNLFGTGSVAMKNLVDTPQAQASAKQIVDILNQAGLNAQYSEDILYAIYKKACVNGTMNGLCTILMSNMAEFGETAPAHDIVTAIVKEFSAVAAQEGVELNVAEIVDYIEKACYNRETIGLHHPSMYQDLIENNRLTEIDFINGAIVKKAIKYGISTPYCQFLTHLVHCKETILGAH